MKVVAKNPHLSDYKIYEKIEAGLALKGWEVKSLRVYGASLRGSSLAISKDGLWLVGLKIHPYKYALISPSMATASRRLLLHKKEIDRLRGKEKAKFILLPVKIYWRGKRLKLELAVAHKLRKWQKKEKMKKEAANKEIRKILKRREL